tara:strand:+ start:650 stop:1165 length:516 start_codon:yes stop_codon:yes gene_type:complete
MPSLEDLENLALLGLGGALGRSPKGTARALAKGGRFVARRYPLGLVALGVYEAYDRGYLSRDRAERLLRDLRETAGEPASGQGGDPTFGADMGVLGGVNVVKKSKRKVSKANKAMKQAMKATKNNFKQATKIASKANPATKSKIGKGATKAKRLARKIRKSVWGVTKRFKK